jgi:glycosyltransferase involved in cell wall biosynthesis
VLRVARRRGIPMVYEIRDLWENASIDRGKFSKHSLSYRVAHGVESYVLRRADSVVTICEGLRNELASRVPDTSKLHVVANGVDVEAFQPSPPDERVRERWKLAGKQVILYAGTFQPYEGLDLLVRAMPEILRRSPRAHLVIVGGSPGLTGGSASLTVEERQLRAAVDEHGVVDHVTFTGRIPHDGVREMYAIADVLAYPRRWTRTTALTTPLKPLEGMAMGKPVIASDVPAMRELVADGKTGLLFRAGDHAHLAARCCELLADHALMERLGTAGRETACRERQWAHLVARYLPIYESLT